MEKKKSDNNAHLHGFVNDVRINSADGKNYITAEMATYEQYKNNADEKERKTTYHKVSFVTTNEDTVKEFKKVQEALANNRENRDKEGFEPKTFMASVDGKLVTRENEKDGVKYYNQLIVANEEDFKLGAKRKKNEQGEFIEPMNSATFKGNIADIQMHDGFAIIAIGTHYYVPGQSENFKGEVKDYTEKTSYVRTRIDEGYRPKTFEALKSGEIAVGDLIEARGQMHNNNYEDKNGISRRGIIVDPNWINVVAKKQKQSEAEAEKVEKKEEKKEEKKAAPAKKAKSNKKKGMTM